MVTVLDAEPFPLDVQKLAKGDVIPPEECERIVGVKRTHSHYSLKLCALAQLIQAKWNQERGEIVTLVQDHNGIRVCDDNSAVVVNAHKFKCGIRQIRKANVQAGGIDRERLSDEMRAEQERLCLRTSAFLAGGYKGMRVALKAAERSTPRLPGTEGPERA